MYDADTFTRPAPKPDAKSRGGSFFAVARDIWERLWSLETRNRLHFVVAYLVLAAGSGSDHRLTKWSAKAIEQYVGIGKPRGQRAIQELVDHGLISRTAQSTRLHPQYRLPELARDTDPIFLPVALITGLGGETPILRRLREIGDPYVLRMLGDLYGLVEIDATGAPPIASINRLPKRPALKLFEAGVHAIWEMTAGDDISAQGPWRDCHCEDGDETAFRARSETLQRIGALSFETWVFDGAADDADPLFPVAPDSDASDERPHAIVTRLAGYAALAVAGDRAFEMTRRKGTVWLPLPAHQRAPELRGVLRLTVEADTPGRRLAYAQGMTRLEAYGRAFIRLRDDADDGEFGKVMRVGGPGRVVVC